MNIDIAVGMGIWNMTDENVLPAERQLVLFFKGDCWQLGGASFCCTLFYGICPRFHRHRSTSLLWCRPAYPRTDRPPRDRRALEQSGRGIASTDPTKGAPTTRFSIASLSPTIPCRPCLCLQPLQRPTPSDLTPNLEYLPNRSAWAARTSLLYERIYAH